MSRRVRLQPFNGERSLTKSDRSGVTGSASSSREHGQGLQPAARPPGGLAGLARRSSFLPGAAAAGSARALGSRRAGTAGTWLRPCPVGRRAKSAAGQRGVGRGGWGSSARRAQVARGAGRGQQGWGGEDGPGVAGAAEVGPVGANTAAAGRARGSRGWPGRGGAACCAPLELASPERDWKLRTWRGGPGGGSGERSLDRQSTGDRGVFSEESSQRGSVV